MQVLLWLGLGAGTLLLWPSSQSKRQGRLASEAGRSCKSPGKVSGCREARPWAIRASAASAVPPAPLCLLACCLSLKTLLSLVL